MCDLKMCDSKMRDSRMRDSRMRDYRMRAFKSQSLCHDGIKYTILVRTTTGSLRGPTV